MYVHVSAGDVACIYRAEWQADQTVFGWWEKIRMDIQSVDKYEDSIVILADVHSVFYQYWKGTEEITKTTQTIVKYRNRHTDIYPNDTMMIRDMYWPVNESWVISKLDYHEWRGLKKTQVILETNDNSESTALYPYEGLFSYELYADDDEYVLVEHSMDFGFLEFFNSGFEWGASDRLVGYIDDGLEYGEIYPLDMFVGTNQLSTNSNSLIYPNPAKDFITIQSPTKNEDIAYKIYNLNGILLKEGELNQKESRISVKELPKGMNFIEIYINGEKSTQKWIKN